MTWGKVSDRLHSHSKVRRAREAMALWVLALSWSCDELTGGVVPEDMPELLIQGGSAMAERLVSVGLWERIESGFRFHDWDEYQPSAEDEKQRRSELSRVRSEAGKKGNAKRWGRNSIANASQTDRKTIATASQNDRPDPDPEPRASLSPRASDSPEPVSVAVDPATQPVAERPWYLDPWSVVNRLTERSKGKIRLAVIGHERELSRALGGAAKAYPDLGAVIDRWADLASRDEATWWRGQWTMGALLGKPNEQGVRSADALALCLAESYARLPKATATTGDVKRLDSKATVALAATSAFGRTIQNAGERRQ